jgi:hypothetical protein
MFARIAVLALMIFAVGCSNKQHLGPRIVVKPPPDAIRVEQTKAWLAKIREIGKPGHWLLIRGYKDGDNFIVMVTNTPLSHAAILDIENERVVESVATGVVRSKLDYFVDHAHRVLLIEPRWWSADRGKLAAAKADSLVGKKYDWFGLVGIEDDQRFYCSELAFHVYKPYQTERDHVPMVIEPALMYLWGNILWDSGERD